HVWAISGIPNPQSGYHAISVYANVSYLLNLKQQRREDCPDLRVWPWILWMLWKSRIEFIFKGSPLDPSTILERALQGAVGEIELAMARIEGCRLISVGNEANKGATFINVQSVTRQGLIRSYVQNGHPPWLFELGVGYDPALVGFDDVCLLRLSI
ncbi:hypothetical protein HID58_018553, partial [Brassica napus]